MNWRKKKAAPNNAGNGTKAKIRLSWKVIIAVLVIVAVLIAGLLALRNFSLARQSQCGVNAHKPLYQEAADVLKRSYSNELQTLSDKIKKQPNFKTDPNCLYPLVVANYYMQNLDEAKEYLASLEGRYDEKAGFAKEYRSLPLNDMEKVRRAVQGLEERDQEFNFNASGI